MIADKPMLVTYPDSLNHNLCGLKCALEGPFSGLFGNVHILPFFPSSGDRGFAPITYDVVSPEFGTWDDIESIAGEYHVMCDFMINHISRHSEYFRDYIEKGDDSPYKDMFIQWDDFWPEGEIDEENAKILYRRKPVMPYSVETLASGKHVRLWCTFSSQQIDIDLSSSAGKAFVEKALRSLVGKGISCIRLDAFAYGIKKRGSTCFFVEPEIWDMFSWVKGILEPYGVDILPEIHNSFLIQNKLVEHGFYVYDFSLPMILLHALYSGSNSHIVPWLRRSPKYQFTTLDTHDGIGVIDVQEILSEDEISFTKESIYSKGWNVRPEYNSMLYNNLDIYQINSTYYSALGNDDAAYLTARAIQIFAPGIPQIYYVGLLAGENDLETLEKTREGRSINRHNFTAEEIEKAVNRTVVRILSDLLRLRSERKAMSVDAVICVEGIGSDGIKIKRDYCDECAILKADLARKTFRVTYLSGGKETVIAEV